MIEIYKFVFSSFWVFIGSMLILSILVAFARIILYAVNELISRIFKFFEIIFRGHPKCCCGDKDDCKDKKD